MGLCLLLSQATPVFAERLPLRFYTVADGLPDGHVERIIQDSHGLVWFATDRGLTRFDGYSFVAYDVEWGLPHRIVSDVLEIKPGVFWVGPQGGLCRLDLSHAVVAGDHCTRIRTGSDRFSNNILRLYRDRAGRLWIGTEGGLFTLDGGTTARRIDLGSSGVANAPLEVRAFAEDDHGDLWIGTTAGLARRSRDGKVERFTVRPIGGLDAVLSLLFDRAGRLWVGHVSGLLTIDGPDVRRVSGSELRQTAWSWRAVSEIRGRVHALQESYDGRIWIGSENGLTRFDGRSFRTFTTTNGLEESSIASLMEDRDRTLWIGTDSSGVAALAASGMVTFGGDDGLASSRIASIFEDRRGELCVTAGAFVHRFDGTRFIAVRPNVPRRIRDFGWGWYQTTLQDRSGTWWVPTGEGLLTFASINQVEDLASTEPAAIYSSRTGLPGDEVFRLYEDAHGDIWIGTISLAVDALTRWERRTRTFHSFSPHDGVPRVAPTAFAEDRSGNLWIGFYDGGLTRYRDGVFTWFRGSDGVPGGQIRGFHLDDAGRLWIATSRGGVARVDHPEDPHPRFAVYTTIQGLASNEVRCITSDRLGRVYIGSVHAIDVLNPTTGAIRRYSAGRELGSGELNVAFRDRRGVLWFGTLRGLVRFDSPTEWPRQAPAAFISSLQVGDRTIPLSAAGETDVKDVRAGPDDPRVRIEFVGLGSPSGTPLRYQYRLEGADRDWMIPTDKHHVDYASLAPGRYRFFVRAVSPDGLPSATPASITLFVDPPLWRRPTSLVAIALGLIALVYWVHRLRVARLVAVERVRTQIAGDLHDDIGASLSRVAVLTEVVRRDIVTTHPGSAQRLGDVADSARALVDSMGDIIWSVDPRRDDLASVVIRLRQFASTVLEARGIKYDLRIAPELDQMKLGPERRRDLFLILKEAITNVVRHASCDTFSLDLRLEGTWIVADVRDDGTGLPEDGRHGHGLGSMRARAARAGGSLEISSCPQGGTHVVVRMPLG